MIPPTISARPARPPTTPPAIAPALVEDCPEFEGEEEVAAAADDDDDGAGSICKAVEENISVFEVVAAVTDGSRMAVSDVSVAKQT
jgi:hypothetical protein